MAGSASQPLPQPPSPLVQRVHHQLRARITSGEYPPHSRLPGEHDLSALFGVSRPVVREALRRLREDGLVFSRQGAGTFVRGPEPESGKALAYAPVGTIADVQRCYEFRLEVEPANAFYAAQRNNRAALDTIERALDLLRDTTYAHRHREDADYAFHISIAEASNNYFFLSSMQALKEHITVGMKLHGLSLLGPSGDLAAVLEEHASIFAAIRDHKAEEARDAMRRHIQGSYDRLFEGKVLDLAL
ncbi:MULTISPECIES: FadR/GntR family transcriptional regulator [Azorhizobium]|uniref:Transcriptional regulator n=1 Tax=Azorhizobium caulinodans (strain ATCC 43989 / DSM 5975 / JCM 20966 / LMG 6465 / NBRC 14845 / NCIMB 13405 / ORS 571) TaxID=438753 RepID=A8I326_AZOC5|nr:MULTISPECIES: FadR/GntR family transcriptional regulator [Azorhizobium]TDT99176.1 GntR family transcriptional repressor for pyruvate dehydrogenase complex [Azorhizobium sp. AG788]BAF87972.1 transcriptional regulator [Azorhizobium caulinodans ORS 571]